MAQSSAILQDGKHSKPPESLPAQLLPPQQAGAPGPHAPPALLQPQSAASTQNPDAPSENGSQQLLVQSVFLMQSGRQPAKVAIVDWIQAPLQQLLAVVVVLGVQLVSATFLQGLSQAALGLQILTPTSCGSVQQPVSGQSVLIWQVTAHCLWPLPLATQEEPAQHASESQLLPVNTQS